MVFVFLSLLFLAGWSTPVPEFAKVRCWPSCDVNGLILVWFHCDGLEPTWEVPEQQEITRRDWVYRGRTEHYINAHIEVGVTIRYVL